MEVRDSSQTLTSGEFGRRCGLSIKALRLYDLSGLLPPASVDPVSGYRKYHVDQLERARAISLLRRLDMPLAMVAEVLSGSQDEALVHLDHWWSAQEAALQAKRGTLNWLRDQLTRTAGAPVPHLVQQRDVPDIKIAVIRAETDQQGLLEAIQTGESEIRRILDAAAAVTTAEHWVLFHGFVTPDSAAPIEICVPFTGAVEPAGAMAIRLEPAHREVFTTLGRDDCYYPHILHAYDAVEDHRSKAGLPAIGPPREIYFALWDQIDAQDPFVHIAQPVSQEN